MTTVSELDSGWSTGVGGAGGLYRDFFPALGARDDAAATAVGTTRSGTAYLKGVLAELIITESDSAVNAHPRFYVDPEAAIGEPNDTRVGSPSEVGSMTAILKGILRLAGV